MLPASQTALYVDEDANFTVRDDTSQHVPEANELLIKVQYSGVNPADVRHAQFLGIRSTIIGYDFAGRVVQAPKASIFAIGEIVAGYTPSGLNRPLKYDAHQDIIAVPDDMVYRVPSNLPESHAAALTVVAMTAADAVYNIFKAPLPTQPVLTETPLLIWGASSSVGLCALQFAKASGFRHIFVTASPARHELLKSLGATHIFDYSSPSVTGDI